MSKILTLTATGLAGLVLGAGIGVAAAQGDGAPTPPAGTVTSMDEMHAAMVDQMPAELAEQCDQMHRVMSEHMADGDHGSMMGSMTSAMGAGMPGDHSEHHPETEG